MIAAVIVTYNRKELLAQNIEMLLKQNCSIDRIYIVDNCSTDGTYQHLYNKGWISNSQFEYIKTASNIGGAGGFYTGVKVAYEAGYDYIILMDDDGKPADETTIPNLVIKSQELYKKNKKLFVNSLVLQGDLLSFKIDNMYTVNEALAASNNDVIMNAANPFNGTLITKELVKEIGYPNPDFFIKGDEVNYKQRAYDAGSLVVTVTSSRYIHPRPDTEERIVLGKKVPFFVETPWKEYYAARNFTFMYKQRKQYKGILFELIFVKMLAILSMKCQRWRTIKMLFKGVSDGWNGRLGATIRP